MWRPVHVEFFADGIEGIARAKYELVEALPEDGIAFLNADDERVREFGRGDGGAGGVVWDERGGGGAGGARLTIMG